MSPGTPDTQGPSFERVLEDVLVALLAAAQASAGAAYTCTDAGARGALVATRGPAFDDLAAGGGVTIPLVGSRGRPLAVIRLALPDGAAATSAAVQTTARVSSLALEQAGGEFHRSAALLELFHEMDLHLELADVLAAICRKTVEAFGCQRTSVFFYSRRVDAYVALADCGTPAHIAARFMTLRYDLRNIPHADDLAAGRTAVITRGRSADDDELLTFVEAHALALVPLRTDGLVRGVLNVGLAEGEFSERALRDLEFVALHVAHAVVRARALRATAEAARFRAAVSALAVELAATPSRARNFERLFEHGRDIVGASTGVLLLTIGDELVVASTDGATDRAGSLPLATDASDPVVRALTTRAVVLENDHDGEHALAALRGMRSVLAIPLIADDDAIGVLVFGDQRSHRFAPGVAEEAPVLGSLAAATLRNLELLTRLQEANEQLRRVGTLKDQFLANVSHDLRTPLNVIIGYAQLTLEDTFGRLDRELRDIWGRVLASARQQLALVEDLFDLSRLELDTLAVKPEPVALAPLFEEMKFLASTLVRHKPVRVRVSAIDPDLHVEADPSRLRQILTNLLSNAAKFTDEGAIELAAERCGDAVLIGVHDTGPGIAPEHRTMIFEPFRQVPGARAVLGAGLGLAIARRLAKLMRGSLTVDGSLGHGSTFWLTLPLAVAADVARAADAAPTSGTDYARRRGTASAHATASAAIHPGQSPTRA